MVSTVVNPVSNASGASVTGFIKAVTDAPDVLLAGFAKVDKILKALFVRKLYLYPRCHEWVAEELEEHPPKVQGISIPLTPHVKEIQQAIAACVQVRNSLQLFRTILYWTHDTLWGCGGLLSL
jgi:DNA excision repair protein ERCC-4